MKIHIAQFYHGSSKGINASLIRRILSLLPAEWLEEVSEVNVTDSLVLENSRCWPGHASFNPIDRRLTIYGRDCNIRDMVAPIAAALAAHHLGFPKRRGHRLSESDAKKLFRLIERYVAEVLTGAFPDNKTLSRIH